VWQHGVKTARRASQPLSNVGTGVRRQPGHGVTKARILGGDRRTETTDGYGCAVTQQQWGQPPWSQGGGQPGWGRTPGQPAWGQGGGPWNQPPGAGRTPAPVLFGRAPQGPGFGSPQLGQPYYAPGQFPPPRRRTGLRSLLFALMLLAVVAFIGLVGTNLSNPTSDVTYQNDNYKVPPPDRTPPPLPEPQTYAEAEQLVTNNKFYRQTAPIPVRCGAQPINVATADDAQLKAHFESLMECLVRVWGPPVEQAGFQIVRPTVTIYGKEITTRCGKSDVNAFYCSADQQVYFSNQLPDYVKIVKTNKWAADVVMAHEFGHGLQARTAILISSHALGQNSGSNATELEMSRRLETQADCFAGMFTRAVSVSLGIQQSDTAGIEATFAAVGDDTISGRANVLGNHGLARSRQYWGSTGLGTSTVGKCNTFTAGSSLVR
jgi:predicted metalloprotease